MLCNTIVSPFCTSMLKMQSIAFKILYEYTSTVVQHDSGAFLVPLVP